MRFISIIVFIFFLLSSCSQHSDSPQKILRINIMQEPPSLDPRKVRDLKAMTIVRMLFEGLTRTGKDGNLELALAKRVEKSADERVYTFHLRESLWSDGSPVTSYDFAYSWKTILDPAFPTDIANMLFVIDGARAAKIEGADPEKIGIQTPDSKTLVVRLEEPVPYFLELVKSPAFFAVPEMVDRKNAQWALNAETIVSNGPFVMKQWIHEDRMEVKRNDHYWDSQGVCLQGIELFMVDSAAELRMFQDHQLDWAGSPLSIIPSDAITALKEGNRLQVRPFAGTCVLKVNTLKDSPLADPLFRRALALAVDRRTITEHVLQGGQTPAMSLVPPSMGLSETGYFQDRQIKQAKEVLQLYLERENKTLDSIKTLTLLYVNQERAQAIALTLQQQIRVALGLSIELQACEERRYYEKMSQMQYELSLGSWLADFDDPVNFLDIFKDREQGTNNTGWEHPKYVEALGQSVLCSTEEARKEYLRQAESLLMDQMPIIPIFHYALNFLKNEELDDVTVSDIGQIDFRWSTLQRQGL